MKSIGEHRHYLDSDLALKQAAAEWQQLPALAFDTEFIRTDTFHPQPALIQVSDGRQCWLVDVIAIRDFSPMTALMANPAMLKILHAAGEDLEVFDCLLGTLPTPLFDTQVAASFCGHGASIGYSRLVHTVLDIELSKDQSRSDWLARPLTSEQLHYACLDVLHLPALHQHLQEQLDRQQRAHWAEEDNHRQLLRYREQREAAYSIDRINHAWRLDDDGRRRLWHLLLGRDALARQYNKPRNHIARDPILLDLARRPPRHVAELSGLDGLHPSGIRQWGNHLVRLANEVPDGLVCPPIQEPLGKLETGRVKTLRSLTDQIATGLALPPELLARRQELESVVRLHRDNGTLVLPERFQGWRGDLLSSPFADLVADW